MFIQTTKTKRKGKIYYTHLVKEAFRTPKGPRSRTICNITKLSEEVRLLIGAALKGSELISGNELELEQALDYGGIAVLRKAWERYGLDRLFEHLGEERDRKLLKAMIFARVLFPSSKLKLADRARGTVLAAACGLDPQKESFDEDDLYRAMDSLTANWVKVEQTLYNAMFPESVSLVLYDLTSVYFEGRGPWHLSQYGYSRDHRADRKQVLLAVATDTEGVPLHIEVLRGNRGDNATLAPLLHTLRRRFKIKNAIFVFDGGMSSRINLEQMEADQLDYVTRFSSETLKTLLRELPKDNQPQLWDCTDAMEVEWDGKRYILATGKMRKERDRLRRQNRIEKAEKELNRLCQVTRKDPNAQKLASEVGRTLQQLKAHKYFDYHINTEGKICWNRKEDIIGAEAKQDGWYILKTTLAPETANPKEVLKHYKNLLDVEHAFQELKSYLKVRPVFHYRPDCVRNHARICFLAYYLIARLSREWKQKKVNTEVAEVLRQLQCIRVGDLSVGNKTWKRLFTKIPKELNSVLQELVKRQMDNLGLHFS